MDIDTPQTDPREEAFRQDNQKHSFRQALYSVIAGASFIGVLTNLVGSLVKGGEAAAWIGEPMSIAVMAGFSALGVAATYFAQRENTHLKMIGDEHLAYENSKCIASGKTPLQCHEHVHHNEHHKRSDGKSWAQYVAGQTAANVNDMQPGN